MTTATQNFLITVARFKSRLNAVTLTRRGRPVELSRPALHRVVDATAANLKRPALPYEEQATSIGRGIKNSPLAHAAALKLAKVGAGAGIGGYLGHRAMGRKGIRRGAKAGVIAGLLFSQPATRAAARAGIAFAAKVNAQSL